MHKDSKIRGLFILHEGVSSTIFQSQVFEHIISLKEKNTSLDILSFEVFSKMNKISTSNKKMFEERKEDIRIYLKKGINIYFPFSTIMNLFILFLELTKNENKYTFIHARSDYTTFLCLLLKPIHRLPVIWDCRGDSIDELKDAVSRKTRIFRETVGKLLLYRQSIIVWFNKNYCDGAIFVSDSLLNFHRPLKTKNIVVVPCPVPDKLFFFDQNIRSNARIKYKIKDTNNVYLYSGSLASYQSIEKQKELYWTLLKNPENMIIFSTPDSIAAKKTFNDMISERFLIITMKYEEMNILYNLSDFAIMLREPKQLNWVASPTKFGEYCMTGLPVMMNDTIEQATNNAKELGNHLHIDELNLNIKKFKNKERETIAEKAKIIYSRNSSIAQYINLYKNILSGNI